MKNSYNKLTGNSAFNFFLEDELSKVGSHNVLEEMNHMESAKDKNEWFKNHPMLHIASILSNGKAKTEISSISPKILVALKSYIPQLKGATIQLINKLIVNPNFIRMFVVNQTFRSAALAALQRFNESIEQGTTGKSKSYQL